MNAPRWLMALALGAALGGTGCGDDGQSLVPRLWMTQAQIDATAQLRVWLLGPYMSDGTVLACGCLTVPANQCFTTPDDGKVQIIFEGTTDFAIGQPAVEIEGVPAGDGLVVLIEALDGAGNVVGSGCEDGILIRAGTTNEVTLVLGER